MRLETYATMMTSIAVIMGIALACCGFHIYKLEQDIKEYISQAAIDQTILARWRKWVEIQKGVIEKHYAYLQAGKLGPSFDYWAKESMRPDPELMDKIAKEMAKHDETEVTIVVPDAKVEVIPPLLQAPSH